jgi:DNA replication protein DnaC
MNMSDSLLSTLKKLRLSGLAESLEIRLHEAATTGLGHRDFLELLLQDELLVRNTRLMSRRTAAANFRELRRLEDFDFGFNPSIKKDRVFDLATCKFVRERRDVLLVGPPGTGKSHLAQAIGLAAIRAGSTAIASKNTTIFGADWCAHHRKSAFNDFNHQTILEFAAY